MTNAMLAVRLAMEVDDVEAVVDVAALANRRDRVRRAIFMVEI